MSWLRSIFYLGSALCRMPRIRMKTLLLLLVVLELRRSCANHDIVDEQLEVLSQEFCGMALNATRTFLTK
jgi:hypothetical protein